MKKEFKPGQETTSLSQLQQEQLQEEFDQLEDLEIEVLENRLALMTLPTQCGTGCGCDGGPTNTCH